MNEWLHSRNHYVIRQMTWTDANDDVLRSWWGWEKASMEYRSSKLHIPYMHNSHVRSNQELACFSHPPSS